MVQAKSYKSVEVMTTYLPDFSPQHPLPRRGRRPGIYTGFRSREVALIELRSLFIPNEGTGLPARPARPDDRREKRQHQRQRRHADRGGPAGRGSQCSGRGEAPRPAAALPHFPRGGAARERVPAARAPRGGHRLFRGDGGIWKLEAKKNIADYFNTNLADLIEAGKGRRHAVKTQAGRAAARSAIQKGAITWNA